VGCCIQTSIVIREAWHMPSHCARRSARPVPEAAPLVITPHIVTRPLGELAFGNENRL
jgi:hypothetical protein